MSKVLPALAAISCLILGALGQNTVPTEEDYYKIIKIPIPEGIVLEAGGLEVMPDKKLAVSTRRGDVYMVENAFEDTGDNAKFSLWAEGLHEVLGLSYADGWLYATQRPEVTRIKDLDGDGRADLFETVSDGWEISGDYHEYAFGSKFDKEGNMWVVLCLTGSFSSKVPYRGWCVRVTKDGKMIPTASGIRSPGGIGLNALGEAFYCDNQGPWNGTSALKHLAPGSFQGHPGGFGWYDLDATKKALGEKPAVPVSGSRFHKELERLPKYRPPAILIPHGKLGNSASGIACDESGGKFGPFKEQLFVSDQTHSVVNRCFLEKINGFYQGACFPFKKGFGFDTFTGLPEDWHSEPSGTYSSFGSIPKIKGGEFIVGKFEDTLPKFFSQKRPLASLINFDADLYSSTLCALNYSNKVIDEKTILVFDEFIMNKNWEKDEYKALNEFCDNLGISYDVLAVSFFTNQVAVKLKKK